VPRQARHAAGLVLAGRGYRSVAGGPFVWNSTAPRRAAQGLAGRWSGYFVHDAYPVAVFDLTEWIDRDRDPAVVRYSYQVRYCSGLRHGMRWQYRLDYHPLTQPHIYVPHFHSQDVRDDEHDPHPWGRFLKLAEALPILENHALPRLGPCSGEVPGLRDRAPNPPSKKHVPDRRT
jgi:hypothetical protein